VIKKALTVKKVVSFLTGVVAIAVVVRELTAATHAIGVHLKKIKSLWKT
jgi:hypothetical protein